MWKLVWLMKLEEARPAFQQAKLVDMTPAVSAQLKAALILSPAPPKDPKLPKGLQLSVWQAELAQARHAEHFQRTDGAAWCPERLECPQLFASLLTQARAGLEDHMGAS